MDDEINKILKLKKSSFLTYSVVFVKNERLDLLKYKQRIKRILKFDCFTILNYTYQHQDFSDLKGKNRKI